MGTRTELTLEQLVAWLKRVVGDDRGTRVRPYTMWRAGKDGERGRDETIGLEIAGTSSTWRGSDVKLCSDEAIKALHERWPSTKVSQYRANLTYVGAVKALVLLLGDAAPDAATLKREAKAMKAQADAEAEARRVAWWSKQVREQLAALNAKLAERADRVPVGMQEKLAAVTDTFTSYYPAPKEA